MSDFKRKKPGILSPMNHKTNALIEPFTWYAFWWGLWIIFTVKLIPILTYMIGIRVQYFGLSEVVRFKHATIVFSPALLFLLVDFLKAVKNNLTK